MNDKPVALVTGGNQGIGLQIAKDLVGHGFTVLVGSRNFERGETAAKEIGSDAYALQLDVTDQASISAAEARIRSKFGRLDMLVNNAAISNTSAQPGTSIQEYFAATRTSNREPRRRRARGGASGAARLGRPDRDVLARNPRKSSLVIR